MACQNRINKNCEDCGVLMVGVVPGRKYCLDCAKKRGRAYQIEYSRVRRENRRKKGAKPQELIINPNKKYCNGCVYWGADYETNACCNYIFAEGHSRPCPPGKCCTEKIIGKRKKIPCGE